MFRASLRLRAINIGQDRYRRTYWVLPLTGGVYAEGMESGSPEHYEKAEAAAAEAAIAATQVKLEVQEEEEDGKENVKKGQTEEEEGQTCPSQEGVKIEKVENDGTGDVVVKVEKNDDVSEKMNANKKEEHKEHLEGDEMFSESCSNGASSKHTEEAEDSIETRVDGGSLNQEQKEVQENSEKPTMTEVLLSGTDSVRQESCEVTNTNISAESHEMEIGEKVSESETGGLSQSVNVNEKFSVEIGKSLCTDEAVDGKVSAIENNGNFGLDDEEYVDDDDDDDDGDYDSMMNDSKDASIENSLDREEHPFEDSQATKSKVSADIAKDVNDVYAKEAFPHMNGDMFSCDESSPLCVTVSLSSPSSDKPDISVTRQLSAEAATDNSLSIAKTPLESLSLSSEFVNPSGAQISESLTVAVSLADPNTHSPMLVKTTNPSQETERTSAKGVVIDLDALSSDPKQNNVDLISVDKSPRARAINGWGTEEMKDKDILLSPHKNCMKSPGSVGLTSPNLKSIPHNSNKADLQPTPISISNSSESGTQKSCLSFDAGINSDEDKASGQTKGKLSKQSDIENKELKIDLGEASLKDGDHKQHKSPNTKESSVEIDTDCSKHSPDSEQKIRLTQDILKVPHVASSPRGLAGDGADTLVSILNYSIQQAYMEENQQAGDNIKLKGLNVSKENNSLTNIERTIKSNTVLETKDNLQALNNSPEKVTPSTFAENQSGTTLTPSTSSLLSSSLLFSAIPKFTQGLNITTTTVTSTIKSDNTIKSVLAGSSSQSTPLSLEVPRKNSAVIHKAAKSRGESSTNNHLGGPSSSTSMKPIPAHSQPINPQPLPPFHPSAQVKSALDLTPPAAHSGNKHKSSLPLALFPSLPLPSTHRASPHTKGYLPGLPHPYHFGPTSASETLSSLASIVSPPPAHQQQPHRFTPTTKTTASTFTPVPTPLSSSTPKSSLISQKDVGESAYTSSELLQQAASHVRRTAEGKKLSPTLLSHMAANTTTSSTTSSAASSLSPLKSHGTSTSPSSPRGIVTCASSKEDFLSAYTVPPSHSLSLSPASSAASLSPSRGGGGHQQINSSSSRPHTPVSASSLSSTAEIVDHSLWFSILPRAPCDDQSITMPISQQQQFLNSNNAAAAATSLLMTLSTSPSALSSLLNSPTPTGATGCGTSGTLDSLLPALQANPSLLTQEMILQLLQSPSQPGSGRQSPCSSQGLDSSGDFKVPPPRDMTPLPDPWDLLRAAQGKAQPIPKSIYFFKFLLLMEITWDLDLV